MPAPDLGLTAQELESVVRATQWVSLEGDTTSKHVRNLLLSSLNDPQLAAKVAGLSRLQLTALIAHLRERRKRD